MKLETIKANWKRYSIYLVIAIVFLLIGMGLTQVDTLKQVLINVLSGLINQLPWFIIIFIGFKMISNSIKISGKSIVKNIPSWLSEYEKIKMHERSIDRARGMR